MSSILYAALAATGVYLVLTGRSPRHQGVDPSATRSGAVRRRWNLADINRQAAEQLVGAGLGSVSPAQFLATSLVVGVGSMIPAAAVFGPGVSTVLIGLCAAGAPAVLWRRRRLVTRRVARDSWPRLIEELRVLTGSAGRPIPQALLEVGLAGPEELRNAFTSAQREWALTTDFERTIAVLKRELADPTADATFETLLVATGVGGGLDARLAALAEDRRQDLIGRKDAQAKQSGAKFARLFVILVPAGMALAGLSVGDGAASYRTSTGQMMVSLGVGMVVACWIWASRIMRLPEGGRVFDR